MADTEKKWYVLRAVSGKEAKVKEYIDAQLRQNDKLAERVFRGFVAYGEARNFA